MKHIALIATAIFTLLAAGAYSSRAQNATVIAQQAYIKASNTGGPSPGETGLGVGDNFGWSVALSGDTMVIGAPGEDSNATGVNGNQTNNSARDSGAAYVFVRSGTNWVQQAYLKASNTGVGDNFGWSVAISADTIVIGAYVEDSNATGVNGNQTNNSATDSGAAYVFVREGTNWSQQAYLKASNTGTGDWFGWKVAISGDTVVVGAKFESSNVTGVNGNQGNNSASIAGAAYVFVRSGTNWIQQAYLKASNTGARDLFGSAVAISGDTVVIGAGLEASNATGVNGNQANNSAMDSGAAYVFVRTGTNWVQQAYLKASNTGAGTVLVKKDLPITWDAIPVANVNGTLFFGTFDGTRWQASLRNELWKSDGTEAGTVRVKTFPSDANGSLFSEEFVNVNGTLFFAASDGVNGRELWKSDGTAAGTVLVKDINPGAGDSAPSGLVNVNGTLFFSADGGVNGSGLWKSDGTEAGTVLVKDIYPGPDEHANVNGTLFFLATDSVQSRHQLWKSDGIASGTVRVKDFGWTPTPFSFLNVNGTLFFAFRNSDHPELWKSDGTEAGTVMVKNFDWSPTSRLVNVNGTIFFAVYEGEGIYKNSLWKSDGTPEGTVLIKELNLPHWSDSLARDREDAGDSDPFWLLNVNGTAFFREFDDAHGYELWKSDGKATGTVLVKDIAPGSASSFPFQPVNVKGSLFFVASDLLTGTELWKSDGTDAGTVLVKDVSPGTSSASPAGLLNVNRTLFFNATDVAHGAELWKTDGTAAGTTLVKDINPGPDGSKPGATGIGSTIPVLSASGFQFEDVNGTIFFGADGGAVGGRGLWKSDGTEAGTVFVKDIYPYRSLNVNGTLFFAGQNQIPADTPLFEEWPRVGSKLWKSDGTRTGTVLVKDIPLGDPDYGGFTEFANVNGTLLFTSYGSGALELWTSDGTTAGTVLIKKFSGQAGQLLNVNGALFIAGGQLWKSDGTAAGTVLLMDGYACDLINVNGTLFFGGSDALWKSDGTATGTVVVKRISPNSFTYPSRLVNVNGTLFFVAAADGRNGELWKSDGTAEGTVLVKDAYSGEPGPFDPNQLLNVNGTLFFNAGDASHGYELWKSDGTTSGTVLVKDIYPGVGDSLPSRLPFLYANGALFFPADDGEHGVQLWKYMPDPFANGRPALKIARTGNQVALSWPADGSGYTLEATSDLSSSLNWSKTTDTPTIVGGEYTASASLTSTNTFYRLKR